MSEQSYVQCAVLKNSQGQEISRLYASSEREGVAVEIAEALQQTDWVLNEGDAIEIILATDPKHGDY